MWPPSTAPAPLSSRTPASGFQQISCPMCSTGFTGAIPPGARRTARGWASPSPAGSPTCTAPRSPSARAPTAAALASPSLSPPPCKVGVRFAPIACANHDVPMHTPGCAGAAVRRRGARAARAATRDARRRGCHCARAWRARRAGPGRYHRRTRRGAAEAARDAARDQFAFDRAAIEFDVDTSYTRSLAAARHAQLSRRTADDADSLLKIARLRRDVGDVSELDVRLAAVNAGQLENAAVDDSLAALGSLLSLQLQMGLGADTP